jgi:hypothetical protein
MMYVPEEGDDASSVFGPPQLTHLSMGKITERAVHLEREAFLENVEIEYFLLYHIVSIELLLCS